MTPMSAATDWHWVPLGSVAALSLGKMLDRKAATGLHPTPYLRNINVRWHRFDLRDLAMMDIAPSELERVTLRRGDVVVCEGGEPGRAAAWQSDTAIAIQKALHRVRPAKTLDPTFLVYYLDYAASTGVLARSFTGTTIKHLPKEKLVALQVPLPPLHEQHAIVDRLDDHLSRLDAAVAGLRAAQNMASQFRHSLLHAAHSGSLLGHPASEGDLLPPGWLRASFGSIASVDSNLTDPITVPDLPHIAPNHIESGTGRLLDHGTVRVDGVTSAKHLFRPGHILYSKIRPYLNKVTIVDFRGVCSADMYPISTSENAAWLRYMMLSTDFVTQTSRTQTRTVLPKINVKELSKVEMVVPPIDDQLRLVQMLDDQLERQNRTADLLRNSKRLADAARRSLLNSAFTGELTRTWREKHHG